MNAESPTTAVAVAQQKPMSEAEGMFELIKLASTDPNVDPAKLHSLLDAQERVLNRAREDAYNAAFDEMLSEIPRIVKKGSVGYKENKNDPNSALVEAFKFARFEDIQEVVKPIMRKYGFRVKYTLVEKQGGGGVMTTMLTHKLGHSEEVTIPLALDTSGGKNNIQAMGSTSSYGRRYTLCMLLDIVVIGDDDDGNGGVGELITTDEALAIDAKMKEVGADRNGFMEFFAIENTLQLPKRQLKKAQQMLAAKEAKNKKGSKNASA